MFWNRRPTAKIGFTNSRKDGQPITIHVEPLAEDFTLRAGEQLEIIATGKAKPPWFNIVEWENDSQVYLEGDGDYADFVVVQNGQQLKCGHNRDAKPPD